MWGRDQLAKRGVASVELSASDGELVRPTSRGTMQHSMPVPWAVAAPWVLVVAIIVIVIGMKPDPATVGSCSALLLGAAEAHRRLSR